MVARVEKTLSESVTILIFMMTIAIPGIVMLFGEEQQLSSQEQRRLEPKPEFAIEAFLDGDYQVNFDRYFQDHFGLRRAMQQSARQVRETLYRKSISSNVIIGDDGWRFFDIDGSLHDYAGRYKPTVQNLEDWAKALRVKTEWLRSLGVQYVLVPIPGKMSMYPQHLPDRLQPLAGATRLEEFRRWIDSGKHGAGEFSNVVDAKRALQHRIGDDQLYFRTDTHWNDLGAYLVYVETMNTIRQWLPDVPVVPESRLLRVHKSKEGDIARASGLPADYREQTFAITIQDPCAGTRYRRVESFAKTPAFKARRKKLPVINGCPSGRYRALVVHDSFGQFLKQFVNESFAEVVYMPSYDMVGMRDFIREFAPDVFIDFRVERRFHLLLREDKEMLQQLKRN